MKNVHPSNIKPEFSGTKQDRNFPSYVTQMETRQNKAQGNPAADLIYFLSQRILDKMPDMMCEVLQAVVYLRKF